ncbi:MAG TPA: OsmC family protein, partial [Solirubrobacterales bacterium]|nr:OsmC family protein [Solirubrobacterales bacterium]
MAPRTHTYSATVAWTGNRGDGTSTYRSYGRDHLVSAPGKPDLPASADRTFRGDRDRWSPEELLVAALSGCHMLSYLHLCAVSGVVVTAYEDEADGVMTETGDGGGRFTRVT